MLRSYRIFSRALAVLCAVGFSIPALGQFETRAIQTLSGGAWAVASGDFNRDGNLDIAIVTNGISVLLGNGDGTFRKPVNYVPQGVGVSIVAADFNGDGILDLAVPGLGSDSVEVLLGNGDGTFQTPIVSKTSGFPSFLAAGDFNHDHKLDLAIVDFPYISVLLGNGDGTFQPAIDNSSFIGGHELAIGDFNNDNKLDVVIAGFNGGSSDVGILLGNGDGTLQPSLTYPLSYTAEGIAVADLNHDGNLDAVVPDQYDGVTVLMGDGKGGLQQAGTYVTNPSGQSVAICDLRGDGKLDLVLGTGSPLGVTVLWGNGDGTFQPPVVYATGKSGLPVPGDFNNDRMLDLVLVNGTPVVTTVLNTGVSVFSPSGPLMFPVQLVNTKSLVQTVTLTNTGTAPLLIGSRSASGDFRTSDTCGSSLPIGASCKVSVSFQPKKTGVLHGTVSLVDSASSKPQVILMEGLSTPIALSPGQLSFGSQKVGTTSPPQQVTVTNQSSTTVTFNFIDISGKERKDFSINSETCSVQLAAGATCTVTITFSPTATGSRKAFNYVTLVGTPYPTPVTLMGTGT